MVIGKKLFHLHEPNYIGEKWAHMMVITTAFTREIHEP